MRNTKGMYKKKKKKKKLYISINIFLMEGEKKEQQQQSGYNEVWLVINWKHNDRKDC